MSLLNGVLEECVSARNGSTTHGDNLPRPVEDFDFLPGQRVGITPLIPARDHPQVSADLFVLFGGAKHDRPYIVDAQLPAGPMLGLVSPFESFRDPERQIALDDIELPPSHGQATRPWPAPASS